MHDFVRSHDGRPATAARGRTWARPVLMVLSLPLGIVACDMPRAASAGAAGSSPQRLAVLPFAVHGVASGASAVDAIPELLGRALDGLGGVGTVPTEQVRERAERLGVVRTGTRAETVPAPGEAARVGREVGAGWFVTGSVTSVPSRVRVVATLYADDDSVTAIATSDASGAPDSLFAIVERAAVPLAAALVQRSDLRRSEASSTQSVDALRAYLEGERFRRESRVELASNAFERAVAIDSTFALAWLRLALVLQSSDRTARMYEATARAVAYADRLPYRERLLVQAFNHVLHGRIDDAESLLRQLLVARPDDDEVATRLGMLLARQNPFRGRSGDEALPYHRRALADSVSFFAAAQYVGNVAERHGDLALLDSLGLDARLGERVSSRTILAVQRAFVMDDTIALDSIARASRDRPELSLIYITWFSTMASREPTGVQSLVAPLWESKRTPAVRAWLALTAADAALVSGRPADAEPWLVRAAQDAPRRTLEVRAAWATLPFAAVSRDTLRALRTRLATTRDVPTLNPPFTTFAPGTATVLRPYLLGLLSARLGERDEADRWARETERAATDTAAIAYARALAASVRAHHAWWQGDPATTLSLLERAGLPVSRDYGPTHLGTMAAERWLRGAALMALGRDGEARGWLESLGELSFAEHVYRAPAALLLARSEARAGDWRGAAAHYSLAARLLRDGEGRWRAVRDSARDEGARAAWRAGAAPTVDRRLIAASRPSR